MRQKFILSGVIIIMAIFLNGCSSHNNQSDQLDEAKEDITLHRSQVSGRRMAPQIMKDTIVPSAGINRDEKTKKKEISDSSTEYKSIVPAPVNDKRKKKQNPEDRDLGLGADKEQLGK